MSYLNENPIVLPPPVLTVPSGLVAQAFTLMGWVRCTQYGQLNTDCMTLWAQVGIGLGATDIVGFEGPFEPGDNYINQGNIAGGPETPLVQAAGPDYTGWQFLAVVCDGSGGVTCYAGYEGVPPSAYVMVGLTGIPDAYAISVDPVFQPFINGGAGGATHGSYCYVRAYSAELSLPDLAVEWASPVPVRTASLYTALPCVPPFALGIDQSGHGNDWTSSGIGWVIDSDVPVLPPSPSGSTGQALQWGT